MMRNLIRLSSLALLTITAALRGPADAQELVIPKAVIPKLPARAASIEAFVPKGWSLQAQARGDLNGDGIPDTVFVLHQQDKRNLVDNKNGIGEQQLDTNPRLLCVAFGNVGDTSYTLALQNSTVIPRYTQANLDDYFGDEGSLAVARGAFTVGLHFFASAGGWTAGSAAFTFRYQHQRFGLIGYKSKLVQRNTGETTDTSANYVTGRESVATGSIENDAKHVRWKHLPVRAFRSIDEVAGDADPDQN